MLCPSNSLFIPWKRKQRCSFFYCVVVVCSIIISRTITLATLIPYPYIHTHTHTHTHTYIHTHVSQVLHKTKRTNCSVQELQFKKKKKERNVERWDCCGWLTTLPFVLVPGKQPGRNFESQGTRTTPCTLPSPNLSVWLVTRRRIKFQWTQTLYSMPSVWLDAILMTQMWKMSWPHCKVAKWKPMTKFSTKARRIWCRRNQCYGIDQWKPSQKHTLAPMFSPLLSPYLHTSTTSNVKQPKMLEPSLVWTSCVLLTNQQQLRSLTV